MDDVHDAYEFANGKPLTPMNGANLLYLMEKHGYKARIDLKEAKELLKELFISEALILAFPVYLVLNDYLFPKLLMIR
ncbi:MAG: hypothetical protein IKC93_05220 [Candidatus Methanomethylophilaceae archaeon]|nr:hypothetical protein [Candidatus Methanomethylophilaceae archaeon]